MTYIAPGQIICPFCERNIEVGEDDPEYYHQPMYIPTPIMSNAGGHVIHMYHSCNNGWDILIRFPQSDFLKEVNHSSHNYYVNNRFDIVRYPFKVNNEFHIMGQIIPFIPTTNDPQELLYALIKEYQKIYKPIEDRYEKLKSFI